MDNVSLTDEEMLLEVNKAIYTICAGGQSYRIGSRQLTRADLNTLYKIKNDLLAATESVSDSHLMDNTVVAVFEGR